MAGLNSILHRILNAVAITLRDGCLLALIDAYHLMAKFVESVCSAHYSVQPMSLKDSRPC